MEPRYFIVSIDTEEDQWGSYDVPPTVENISGLRRFQDLCDAYSVRPTYLINYPVATLPSSRAIVAELAAHAACEIGMHCHPWNTPPIEEEISPRNSMLMNLPRALVKAKLECVHDAIARAAGYPPRSFRAGRWGMSEETCAEVAALGVYVETSLTPLLDWSELHGPDYSDHALEAYRFSSPHFRVPDPEGAMVQVPLSIGYRTEPNRVLHGIARSISHPLLRRWRVQGALNRLMLGRRLWLSPELSSAEQMEALGAGLLEQGQPYLHMMFHSTSLIPGLSPYTPDAAAVDVLYDRMEAVFALVRDRGLIPRTLQEVGDIMLSGAPPFARSGAAPTTPA